MPPSVDQNRRTKSLRVKTGKKSGGQLGHKGHTLEFSATPDNIVDHMALCCTQCGIDLVDTPVFKERRQVVDIPPIKPYITEHRAFDRVCPNGHLVVVRFPDGINEPVVTALL